MNRIDRMVGIDGTAHGRMNTSESHLIHVRACTKNPDRKSATIILRLMPTTRKISAYGTNMIMPQACHGDRRFFTGPAGAGSARGSAIVAMHVPPPPIDRGRNGPRRRRGI